MDNCRYSSIQTMGTLDGPGVRFVLFLQGCPLNCGYCHNPETRAFDAGNTASVTEIMARITRCRNYFGKKGGVTVSGGEPLMQAAFVTKLFRECKKAGIHTCIDTSGCIINDDVRELLSVTDLCILDIKMTNSADYRKYIGCDISVPLAFAELLQEMKVEAWLRQVIVCGINDSKESVREFSRIADSFDNVSFAELLPFRKLCESKYEKIGIPFPFSAYPETDNEIIADLSALITKNK